MKKICLWVLLVGFAACSNVSSSELTETSAEDLNLFAHIYEYSEEDLVDVSVLLKTIPDDIGIQFNEGETLQAGILVDSEVDYTSMSYDSNFLDIGETYAASISKTELGDDYYITYIDSDEVETTATFSSEGVPELTAPAEDAEISLGSTVDLTWESQGLGSLSVRIIFVNNDGGSTIVQFSTTDTGSYSLDLTDENFDEMAAGDATITLRHDTEYDSMDGFGDADITISSDSTRQVSIVAP